MVVAFQKVTVLLTKQAMAVMKPAKTITAQYTLLHIDSSLTKYA